MVVSKVQKNLYCNEGVHCEWYDILNYGRIRYTCNVQHWGIRTHRCMYIWLTRHFTYAVPQEQQMFCNLCSLVLWYSYAMSPEAGIEQLLQQVRTPVHNLYHCYFSRTLLVWPVNLYTCGVESVMYLYMLISKLHHPQFLQANTPPAGATHTTGEFSSSFYSDSCQSQPLQTNCMSN